MSLANVRHHLGTFTQHICFYQFLTKLSILFEMDDQNKYSMTNHAYNKTLPLSACLSYPAYAFIILMVQTLHTYYFWFFILP